MTDTRQTWTFAEDEGGTTVITYDSAEHVVEITRGPDCDGTRSAATWFYWPAWDRPAGTDLGTVYRNPAYRNQSVYDVYADDPDAAAFDRARDELGHALLSGRYPLTAPERS